MNQKVYNICKRVSIPLKFFDKWISLWIGFKIKRFFFLTKLSVFPATGPLFAIKFTLQDEDGG